MDLNKDWQASKDGGNKACLCEDGTYSIECCNGGRLAQGIGSVSRSTRSFNNDFSKDFNQ